MKARRHDVPTVDVADGDTLTSGGVEWKVIGTPGHTPGGVCYWSQENNLLISGDTLFAGSIGRTDLQGGDYDALMASIKEKLLNLPGETDVLPGHGQPTSIAREGMYNPFLEPFNEPLEEE
jgi:glyoxylase-like metal-dependent hydrolase (beta-lactamase superfamily II)